MDSYEILPGQGVSEVRFGELRSEHRQRFTGGPISFERLPGYGVFDAYFDNTLILEYDEKDRLKGIELGGVSASLDGVQLLDRPLGEVLAELGEKNIPLVFEGDVSYEFPGRGVYLITPAPEEMDEPTESVNIRPIED